MWWIAGAFGAEPPSVVSEGWATASVGWLEAGDLWVGDALLGSFDGGSSAFLLDRALFSAAGGWTARIGDRHRLRFRVDTRTLARSTTLDPVVGGLAHPLTSDGVPLADAARERAFFDEASYRWRPRGDRSIDLRVGVLPFATAGGRFLVESWPGASASLDLGPLGGPPVVTELRAAVPTTGGVFEAAARVGLEPSAFDEWSVELAVVRDRDGLAPLLETDPGLLLSTFGRANEVFLDRNLGQVVQWIDGTYLDDPYGLDAFLADARTYLDLAGPARLWLLSTSGRTQLGRWSLDGSATGEWGGGTVEGNRVPFDQPWSTPPADWAVSAPRERWSRDWRVAALALDGAATVRIGDGWVGAWAQAASGDPDLVATNTDGEAIRAFVAPDQRFLRTRVFPLDAARLGGAWSFPPGVASSGIVAVGAVGGVSRGWGGARAQLAAPWAWTGSCIGCAAGEPARTRYGAEASVLGWAQPRTATGSIRPTAEVGAFLPGPYFLDDTDPARDSLGELPVGWRVFVGIGGAVGRAP